MYLQSKFDMLYLFFKYLNNFKGLIINVRKLINLFNDTYELCSQFLINIFFNLVGINIVLLILRPCNYCNIKYKHKTKIISSIFFLLISYLKY